MSSSERGTYTRLYPPDPRVHDDTLYDPSDIPTVYVSASYNRKDKKVERRVITNRGLTLKTGQRLRHFDEYTSLCDGEVQTLVPDSQAFKEATAMLNDEDVNKRLQGALQARLSFTKSHLKSYQAFALDPKAMDELTDIMLHFNKKRFNRNMNNSYLCLITSSPNSTVDENGEIGEEESKEVIDLKVAQSWVNLSNVTNTLPAHTLGKRVQRYRDESGKYPSESTIKSWAKEDGMGVNILSITEPTAAKLHFLTSVCDDSEPDTQPPGADETSLPSEIDEDYTSSNETPESHAAADYTALDPSAERSPEDETGNSQMSEITADYTSECGDADTTPDYRWDPTIDPPPRGLRAVQGWT
ncbi:uncharacterized protein IL334_005387 [Kwoniella shivajii]|uniref:Uncharacterized protein n=1 Tax=Kwoniella shivajii TaxID=564305 RepID=A0ABZ1D309_9TREE|nr:hypothetical protein IL334_005387 [Kwoniella shivajii]